MSARIELRGIARATVPSEMNALAIFKRTRRSEPCFTYMSFLEKSSVALAQVVRIGGDPTDDVTMHITRWSSEALHDLFRKKIRVWWPHREEWRLLAQEGEEAALAVLWRRHTLPSSASKAHGGGARTHRSDVWRFHSGSEAHEGSTGVSPFFSLVGACVWERGRPSAQDVFRSN